MALASVILDRVERTLDFDRTSVGVPGLESTHLLAILNNTVIEYHSSFEKSGEPSSILQQETGYTIITDTALAAAVASAAVAFTVDDSSELGASGAMAIWDNNVADYVEFTANNLLTAITGVTGVGFAHEEDDVVSLLYALPSTFRSFRSTEGCEDGVTVDGTPYFFTSGLPVNNKFAIYDNGTTKYLHFPQGLEGDVAVTYNAAPTTVDGETDNVDIPTVDEWYAVWKVVANVAPKLDRFDMQQLAENEAFKILSSSHMRRNVGKRPRVRPMRRLSSYSRSQIFD